MNKVNYQKIGILLGLILVITMGYIDINAQRRKSTKTTRANAQTTILAERKKGAEDVAVQIKNVSKFVFVLGGVANGIEQIDKDVKAGIATAEIRRSNNEFKSNVIASVNALRKGLVRLEIDFRTKTGLKPYLPKIKGIIEDSGRAEDLALAGQFNASGKQLLDIIEKLADVLVAMP